MLCSEISVEHKETLGLLFEPTLMSIQTSWSPSEAPSWSTVSLEQHRNQPRMTCDLPVARKHAHLRSSPLSSTLSLAVALSTLVGGWHGALEAFKLRLPLLDVLQN